MFCNKFGRHVNVECGLLYFPVDVSGVVTHLLSGVSSYHRPPMPTPKPVPIPLQSVSISAWVMHAVAQVELTQVYVNKENVPIEAIYYFPMDSNGGVTHFQAELEGKTIKGVVKPHEEAKATYDKAIQQNQTAFLMESNKPDIFKVSVGFLKPGSQVKIVIGYVTEVKNEKGSNAMRFFIPTTIAPRYNPSKNFLFGQAENSGLNNMTFSGNSPAPLLINVNVALQGKLKSIESPSHQITTENMDPAAMAQANKENWSWSKVNLSGFVTDMDREFVLLIKPEEVDTPRIYLEKNEDSTALMTHLIPSFELDDQKVEIIFVLDRSGSMQGPSIELAKKALALFIHSLPVDCYFNIIGFGSTFQALFPNRSAKYEEWSMAQAIYQHVQNVRADLGGTEILQPLQYIFSQPPIPGYLRQIFVLTDGEVSNTDQVIGICHAHAHSSRVFTLGIGDSASHALVEGMASAGGGIAAFVTNNEPIHAKVLQQLKNGIQPSLTNVQVKWKGIPEAESADRVAVPAVPVNRERTLLGYGKPIESNEPNIPSEAQPKSYWEVPEKIPPIFDGSQLVVFGVFAGAVPSGVEILAESPDGPLTIQIEVSEKSTIGSTGLLHKLAAVKAIRELELNESRFPWSALRANSQTPYFGGLLGPAAPSEPASKVVDLKKQIIRIACKHGLASKYTSFVAVADKDINSGEHHWMMQSRYVPSQVPHGDGGNSGFSSPQNACFSFGSSSLGNQQTTLFGSATSSGANFQSGGFGASGTFGQASGSSGFSFSSPASAPVVQSQQQSSIFGGNSVNSNSMSTPAAFSFGQAQPAGPTFGSAPSPHQPFGGQTAHDFGKPSISTPEDNLHALIATQAFDGSFVLSAAFCVAISKDMATMQEEARKGGWAPEILATTLALEYLNSKLAALKESWELVELKGKKWLEKQLKMTGQDMNTLFARAKNILN